MGARGSSGNNAASVSASSSSVGPEMSESLQPTSQLTSSLALPPTTTGRYRGEISLRGSVSVPAFATYWKVPAAAIPAALPEDSTLPESREASANPRAPKPSRSDVGVLNGSLPLSPWYGSKRLITVGLLLLAAALLYLGFLLGTLYFQKEVLQFAIVMDAGSTGTRVYVYGWAHPAKEPLPVMVKPTYNQNSLAPSPGVPGQGRLYKRMETTPGLDKFMNNSAKIKESLDPLLEWAERQIPKHAHGSTQVFLLATAGLRRLPKDQSEWILSEAWSVVKAFPFVCKRSSVKVILGVEEAFYGWIALNYNFGRLGHVPKLPNHGALDLGGSSLQVTFEPQEVPHGEYGFNLSVGVTHHHLYAVSHPGFGLNDAFEKSVAQLLRKELASRDRKPPKNNRVELKHPCLQKGYKHPYMCSTHCMLPPVAAGGSRRTGPGTTDAASGGQVDLIGAPNWEACQALAKDVIDSSQTSGCKVQPCALGKHQPKPEGHFYGLAGFFIVYKFFGLPADAPLDNLLQKGQEFCKLPWKKAESSVEPQPSIEHYCFRAPYVVSLLRQGLHLHDDQITIGSGDFAWTLGAALWEAGALNPTAKGYAKGGLTWLGKPPMALTIMILVLLSFILVGVICYQRGVLQPGHRAYLPLVNPSNSGSTASPWIPSSLRAQSRLGSITGGALGRLAAREGTVKTPQSPQPMYNPIFGPAYLNGPVPGDGLQMVDSAQFKAPDRRVQQTLMGLQSRRSQSREELTVQQDLEPQLLRG
ncbi:unnamed protein product [Sphagnum jensenii]|uniref:Apyrase n=1 Tax=Sphagnum jensenii TaxID=128206 RepID=A0ABP0WQV9_9BRYO